MNERAYQLLLEQLGRAMAAEAAASYRGFGMEDHAAVGVQVGIDLGTLFATRHPQLAARFAAWRRQQFLAVSDDPSELEREQDLAVRQLARIVGGDA
jgi:hypothetical protein